MKSKIVRTVGASVATVGLLFSGAAVAFAQTDDAENKDKEVVEEPVVDTQDKVEEAAVEEVTVDEEAVEEAVEPVEEVADSAQNDDPVLDVSEQPVTRQGVPAGDKKGARSSKKPTNTVFEPKQNPATGEREFSIKWDWSWENPDAWWIYAYWDSADSVGPEHLTDYVPVLRLPGDARSHVAKEKYPLAEDEKFWYVLYAMDKNSDDVEDDDWQGYHTVDGSEAWFFDVVWYKTEIPDLSKDKSPVVVKPAKAVKDTKVKSKKALPAKADVTMVDYQQGLAVTGGHSGALLAIALVLLATGASTLIYRQRQDS